MVWKNCFLAGFRHQLHVQVVELIHLGTAHRHGVSYPRRVRRHHYAGRDLVAAGVRAIVALHRSQKIAGGKVVAADANGIVYVISVSGPKMYEVTSTFEPFMAKAIPHTQTFQTVDVDHRSQPYITTS